MHRRVQRRPLMGVSVLLHRIVADPKMVQFDTAPPGLTLLTALTVRTFALAFRRKQLLQ